MRTYTTLIILMASVMSLQAQDNQNRPNHHHGDPRAMGIVRIADWDDSGDISSDEWLTFINALEADEEGTLDVAFFHQFMENHRPSGHPPGGPPQGTRPQPGRDQGPPPREGEPGNRNRGDRNPLDRDGDGVLEIADLNDIFNTLDENEDGNLQSEEIPRRPRHRPRRH